MPRHLFVGIDGGATKTLAVCGDRQGNLLSSAREGPSNYQVVGMPAAMTAVDTALRRALEQAGAKEPLGVVFALSGADLPADFALLQASLAERFTGFAFDLLNDSWAAFRAGSDAACGAVSLCGTGANAAARNREGQQAALRSLGYELGNWGGAVDLTREALHAAFRSEEGTGPKSELQEALLQLELFAGINDYDELALRLREDISLRYRAAAAAPRLVFSLAAAGDAVCQDILLRMGEALGRDCAAVVSSVGLAGEVFEVILAGGMYNASREGSPLMVDAFTVALHRTAPRAVPRLCPYEPAVGAYLLALEAAGRRVDDGVRRRIDTTARALGLKY